MTRLYGVLLYSHIKVIRPAHQVKPQATTTRISGSGGENGGHPGDPSETGEGRSAKRGGFVLMSSQMENVVNFYTVKAQVTVDVEISIKADNEAHAREIFDSNICMNASLIDLDTADYDVAEDSISENKITSVEAE